MLSNDILSQSSAPPSSASEQPALPPIEWSWPLEHADRQKERRADASATSDSIHHSGPFEVDRRVLKDVVREKMGGVEVARIEFLSAGTFHKVLHRALFFKKKNLTVLSRHT